MHRTLIALSLATAVAAPAAMAAESADLTIYRSDSSSLFSAASAGSVSAGYALVHETRQLQLQAGQQTVTVDNLPAQLDTEALQLLFPDRDGVDILASRVLLPDQGGPLESHIGEHIEVYGNNGGTLASGTLLAVDNGLLIDNTMVNRSGGVTLVRDYAALQLQSADPSKGIRLVETLTAERGGSATAKLIYPTGGMGWRASYSGVLNDDSGQCTLQLQSLASIANRSGRDWHAATLKLVAGEPNFGNDGSGPQPVMMRSMAMAAPAPEALPEQRSMGAYRSYTVDGAIDLPAGSITQVPLYADKTLKCQHRLVLEHGTSWQPPQPMTNRNFGLRGDDQVSSRLQFNAFENLPAGNLRVVGLFAGQREFLGAARIPDTPENQPVKVTLGTSFVLRGERERTAFSLNEQANTLQEAFRITLSNSGDKAKKVIVREHPRRWHEWTLVSSSQQPSDTSVDTLSFKVTVPAHGHKTLEYAVRYQWLPSDQS